MVINVFKTGSVIEPEKLPVHGSPVGPAVEPLLNRWRHKYAIFYLYIIKIKYNYKKIKIYMNKLKINNIILYFDIIKLKF